MVAVAEPISANAWSRERPRGSPAPVAYEHPFETLPPWPGLAHSADEPHRLADRRQMLARAVELDVVPRLRLPIHNARFDARLSGADPAAPTEPCFDPGAVAEFAALVLAGDFPRTLAHARRALANGIGISALYLDLLAPTARHLGHLWDEDLADFGQITIGIARLHQLLHALSPEFYSEPGAAAATGHAAGAQDRQALLLTTPGEQHDFGLAVVAAFLRRAGWFVQLGTPPAGADLRPIVRHSWFAIVGFSLACEARLGDLRSGIGQIRAASRNRQIVIMVGGPAFILHPKKIPEQVAAVGADMFVADGQQAVAQAHRVLAPDAPRA
jgi:methanogenic corrinoid protein MtbC1